MKGAPIVDLKPVQYSNKPVEVPSDYGKVRGTVRRLLGT
jgi:hypothetical protein